MIVYHGTTLEIQNAVINQIAFCSEKSLSTLTFQSSYLPEE